MSFIITNTLVGRKIRDILIEGTVIRRIGKDLARSNPGAEILDGRGTAAVPSLINGHTHSPMTLLRGAGDDLPLFEWLSDRMWPLDSRFEEEDYYWGNLLAFMEMIRTGTGFFNEMYMRPEVALRALERVALKGMIHYVILDRMDPEESRRQCAGCETFFQEHAPTPRVGLGVALHAVYTCTRRSIQWVRDFSAEAGLIVHTHLCETEQEVRDCRSTHGLSPVEYLDSLGLLSERVVAAHAVHLSDRDMDILADRGVAVVHNPASNMKLSSGVFPFRALKEKGVRVLLGTDSAGSNNNLDMLEEMKLAALLQKVSSGDAALMTAEEIFRIATAAGAECFQTGGGAVEEGRDADLMLVDIRDPGMTPLWDLTSALVYGASGQHVDSLISGGTILMKHRRIPGYDQIREEALRRFERLKRIDGRASG